MEEYTKLPLSALGEYPPADGAAIHEKYLEEYRRFGRKVVVLDDDPTGVQTVHGVSVYTDWEEESLARAFGEERDLFFLLTNSRSFTAEETEREHRILARRIAGAAREAGRDFLLISRGDSTLRGHYPLELDVLRETLEAELGKQIHGQILCPFFREGGRFTIGGVHYVREGEWLIPAAQTEFAADKTFGYASSHLGAYVEEKSGGRYRAQDCIHISLELLRGGRYEEMTRMLMGARDFQPVLVDAVEESDAEAFAVCLLRALGAGKEFLIRSAAALPKVLGNISSRPLLGREELLGPGEERQDRDEGGYGGIVLIGSHVKKTTQQLEALRRARETFRSGLTFLEFRAAACLEEDGPEVRSAGETGPKPRGLKAETARVIAEAERAMSQGRTAVVYTSRTLLAPEGKTKEEMLKLSVRISDALTAVIGGLHRKPRFLVAKGGITSSDVGTKALKVRRALVLGQVQPGVPVWRTGPESRFPGLSYIIFPGNVGDEETLRRVVELLD